MRKRRFHPHHETGKVNVTPMIDVVMCLIIFYLLVGKLAMSQQVKNLPKSGQGTMEQPAAAMVVDILPGATPEQPLLSLDGVASDVSALEAALKARAGGSSPEVRIRAGRDLPYAQLSPVLAACKRAGLTSVRLVAERSN